MTKEEKIKEAWENKNGSNKEVWARYWNYDKAKDHGMDNNGWIKVCGYEPGEGMVCDYMRPPQLEGIETNNGWVKIESEEDLPNTHIDVVLYDTVNNITFGFWDNLQMCFKDRFGQEYKNATHYQPIEKPLKPIY